MAKKSTIALLVLTLVATTLLSACSKNNGNGEASSPSTVSPSSPANESSGDSTPAETKADPFGKYDPPISISTVRSIDATMKLPEGQTYEDNVWSRALAQDLGIDVKVNWTADGTQYDNKLNVTIASGDLPDLMRVTATQLKQLVESDSLADLTEVFDKYASEESKRQYAIGDSIALKSAMVNGKLYAIPNIASAIGGAAGPLIWIRSDWMKKLNLPEPKTIEDVNNIARAFTNNDPDGNGKKDTVGFAFTNDFFDSGLGMTGYFNSFHAYPSIWVKDASGKIVYGSVQPEMKQGLQSLSQMYKDGAIDPEFTVKDGGKVIEMLTAGKAGIFNSAHYFGQFTHNLKVRDPKAEWVPYVLPSTDDQPAKVGLKSPALEYYVVRKGYEHPEAIVKLFNYYYKLTVGKDATKENYDKFMYDPKDGTIQLWRFSPVWSNDATDDLFYQMLEAFEKNDRSVTTDVTAQLIYDNAMKAKAGENSLYGWTLYNFWQHHGKQALPKYRLLWCADADDERQERDTDQDGVRNVH